MCPVRALDTYVHRATQWRRSDQLLVCVGPPRRGLPATKHTISRWIVETITACYESSGLPSPLGVKAHSTRGMAASKAFSAGCPCFGHLQRCGLVHPVHLCPVLRPRHRYYPRFFSPLVLVVMLRHTHRAGICKSGGVGISFPKRGDAARVPEKERLQVTYVTMVPWGNETLRHVAILPASLPAQFFMTWGCRRLCRTCFYASWSLTSPACDVAPFHWSDYTADSEPVTHKAFPKRGDAASRSLKEPWLHT